MPRLLPLCLLALAACAPQPRDGVLTGIVTRGPGTDAPREAGATVRTFDNTNTEMDAVQTAQDGSFEATIPWTGGFFVELDAEGAVPTSFSAVSYSGAVEGGPGDTGRFAVFGLPPGVALVQMVLTIEETEFTNPTLPVRLPAGGAAPLYPLWAELPL